MHGSTGGGGGAAAVPGKDRSHESKATEVGAGGRGGDGSPRLTESLWSIKDVARFLQVSEKTVRRLEARKLLRRCSDVLGVVRFWPRDVRGLLRR